MVFHNRMGRQVKECMKYNIGITVEDVYCGVVEWVNLGSDI